MTQKEKLTKTLFNSPVYLSKPEAEALADWIIGAGVVVLPCKVGAELFIVNSDWIEESFVEEIAIRYKKLVIYGDGMCEMKNTDFGKTVFLTREEAEAALKKMDGEK